MEKSVKIRIIMANGAIMNFNLFPEAAPITVKNFVSLVKKKYFDGLCFHRIIDNFMIQGGGFEHRLGSLIPKKGAKTIKGEFASNGIINPIRHRAGTISMARTNDKNSASSQFFICVADTPFLDNEYAAFGVCSDRQSLDTAIALGKVPTGQLGYFSDVPLVPVVIKTIELVD